MWKSGISQVVRLGPIGAVELGSSPIAPAWSRNSRRLDTQSATNLAEQVADDLTNQTTEISLRHATYRRETGTTPSGNEILDALLKDACPP